MWEIIGDLLGVGVDSGLRAARVRRIERNLAAGRPVRIPCSTRPGPADTYVDGRLHFADGTATFVARHQEPRELALRGKFRALEGNPEWPVAVYTPRGGGAAVEIQAHHRYLPLVRRALQR